MAPKKTDSATPKQPEGPTFRIVGQYARDISFECPQPSFLSDAKRHEMSMEVGIEAKKVAEDRHEVCLKLRGQAMDEAGKPLYVVEVDYAGLFQARNMPEDQIQSLMAVEGASLLYPFAREIMMKAVIDGGYRPTVLEPINFHAMYMHARQQQATEAAKGGKTIN